MGAAPYAGDIRIATTLTNEETRECQEPQPVFYFHTDHLQSTEYLTDSAAKIAEHNEYFAFGETWIDERRDLDNDGRQDYLFTGKELDPETNLYYFGARYYDAQESRWQSADPVFGGNLRIPKNLSRYAYAKNDPLIVVDPSGLTDIRVNVAPPGAKPGSRFFFDPKGKNEIVEFGDVGAFEAAAAGHQTFVYDPEHGLSAKDAADVAELLSTVQALGKAMGAGSGAESSESSGVMGDLLTGAAILNGAGRDAIKEKGEGGSALGIPGGKCDECTGSRSAEAAYLGVTLLPFFFAGALSIAKRGAQTAFHHVFPQEFAAEFAEIGVEIHEYTLELPATVHQEIHAAGWNADWAEFLYGGEDLPTAEEAKDFATQLIHEYELHEYLPLQPYPK